MKFCQFDQNQFVWHCFTWLSVALLATSLGCKAWQINPLSERIVASNDRDWSPQFHLLSTAEFTSDRVQVKNIRNCQWLDENNFVMSSYNREFLLDDIQSVDFIVVPFQNMPAMAHTMLSFGLTDGSYVAVSAEIRTEKGEAYSPILGISNQFELTYVVADERDVIRLRTRHRDADVFLYPTVATPEKAQELFVSVMTRANQLAQNPEFYDTVMNNCTNNIVGHVNQISPNRIPWSFEVLFPGLSDRYAYNLGLLPQSVGYERLKRLARVNDLAERHYDSSDFSQKIRVRQSALREQIKTSQAMPRPF